MRASQWLLGLATSAATVAAIASGCGGSTSGGTSNDSGAPDVTADHYMAPMEAGKEAAPEAAMEAAPCVPDAQITSITVPDGSVPGTDASAATCIACVQAACPMLIAQCNMTCGCPEAFDAFEACVGAGGSVITCGETDLIGAGLPLTDLTCATGCVSACGVMLPTEGGTPESSTGEASTDAPSDAVGQ